VPPIAADETSVNRRDQDGSTFRIDFETAHFDGDFGSDEDIRFDILTTRLRWRWTRAEIRVSLPLLRLEGEVILVGGTPSPGGPQGTGNAPEPPGPPTPNEPNGTGSRTVTGPGDVLVRADYDLVQGSSKLPWLSGLAQVKLPTADDSDGLGTGEIDVEGGLVLVQPLGKFSLFLEGRYTLMGDPPDFDFDDIVRVSAGVSRRVGNSRGRFVYAFWENRTHPVPGREDRRDLLLGTSARVGTKKRIRLSGAVYAGLSETAEDWGLQFMLGHEF